MNKIWIVGIGPGHPDYLLPIAKKKLSSADVIYGGKRHLESISVQGEKRILKYPFDECIHEVQRLSETKQVAVMVSGDTGFYSFLETIKKVIKEKDLLTYPGISSLQYMYAKLNKSYQMGRLLSVHGRREHLSEVMNYPTVGLLTDKVMTPHAINDFLFEKNFSGVMYVGENLSYENERITKYQIGERIKRKFDSLCVVVIEKDESFRD